MPTKKESSGHFSDRLVQLPAWSRFEDPVAELVLPRSDPDTTQAFLVNDETQAMKTKRAARQLLVFTASDTKTVKRADVPD